MHETAGSVLAYVSVATAGNGSSQRFDLTTFPAYIGTDDACAVQLKAGGQDGQDLIAGKHLQVLMLPTERFRLVNLTGKPVSLHSATRQPIPPRGFVDVASGEGIVLGACQLLFVTSRVAAQHVAAAAGETPRVQESNVIELKLDWHDKRELAAGGQVKLTAVIQNKLSDEQLKLTVAVIGLCDEAFYEKDPDLVLNPLASARMVITFKQPGAREADKLPPGDKEIGVRVTAATHTDQPAEQVKEIHVLPVYDFDLQREEA